MIYKVMKLWMQPPRERKQVKKRRDSGAPVRRHSETREMMSCKGVGRAASDAEG